jgi:hypothetical protein
MNALRLSKIFQAILDGPMYVQTTNKSPLHDFLFLKLKLAHSDDINTIQEQLQTEVASPKAQDFK